MCNLSHCKLSSSHTFSYNTSMPYSTFSQKTTTYSYCFAIKCLFEPPHEIMALIALRKLSLQTLMRSSPLELRV